MLYCSLIVGGMPGGSPSAPNHTDGDKGICEVTMLRTSLPYLVKHGLARSTTTKYQSGWSRWVTWCGTKTGISCRPADPYFVAIYLNRVFFIKHTKGAIRDAMFSINWGHRVMGLDSPTENSLVKLAYEGALRLCGGSVNKKGRVANRRR